MAGSRVFDLMRMTVLEFARQALALRSGNAWLVPDAASAQRLAGRCLFRGRIWTAADHQGSESRAVCQPPNRVALRLGSYRGARRSRNALPITDTELNVIEALAMIGLR